MRLQTADLTVYKSQAGNLHLSLIRKLIGIVNFIVNVNSNHDIPIDFERALD